MLQVLTLESELPEWNKFICEEICGEVFYAIIWNFFMRMNEQVKMMWNLFMRITNKQEILRNKFSKYACAGYHRLVF